MGLGLFDIFLFNAIMFVMCCYCEGMEPLLLDISWHALSMLRERRARKSVSPLLALMQLVKRTSQTAFETIFQNRVSFF